MNFYVKQLHENSYSNNPYVQASMAFFKIAVLNKDGIILWANNDFCEVMQYPLNELEGKSLHDLIEEGTLPFFTESEELNRGEPWQGELKNRAKDGSVVWFRTKIMKVNDERAKEERYIATKTNITKTIVAIKEVADQKITYATALEELAFLTSHRVRSPIARALGLINLLKLKAINTDEWDELIRYFENSINELDSCTKELAHLIYKYQATNDLDRIHGISDHPELRVISKFINDQID